MVDGVTLTLNEPSDVNRVDDAGQATGSLLGSLVIVARYRGVQLSKEQLIRDHQLKASDASVKETLGIAHASGLRASATRLRWGDLFNMGTALPAIVLLRNGAAMVLMRTEARLPGWPPVVVLRDPNSTDEAPLLLDEARFTAAWAGDVILVKRDYRLRDEDRPFGMGWVAGQLLRDRRVARDLGVCAIILGVLAITPVIFWRVKYSEACLFSVRNWSDYPNLEIIVVDNASTDGSRENLRELERQDERVQVILNDTNLGVAGGYNVGLRVARGDYVILLNNDTYVTRGWVRDLIRPMQLDPQIGLTGPLTNDIGNEQRVKIAYDTMQEMQQAARRFVRGRLRRTLEVGNLAFFCAAIRRGVLEEIGLLDEVYGLGYYEDDDYCRRASQANYKLVIADDVFVRHAHSVSFDKLGEKAAEQMARNRVIFEQRWGPWPPHRYRDEAGFGA